MCVCVYVCVDMYVCVAIYVYVCVCVLISIHVCVCVQVHLRGEARRLEDRAVAALLLAHELDEVLVRELRVGVELQLLLGRVAAWVAQMA